jgi:membrane protein implicated in regulation of membrane protease activity
VDLSHIYLVCFAVGLISACVSAFFDFFGGHDVHFHLPHHLPGHDAHIDSGLNSSGMPGVSPVSLTIIGSFITAFGGIGLILAGFALTASAWISLPLAVFGGFAIAAVVFLFFNKLFRATQSSSEGCVHQLIGQSATVITPIAPGSVGEIAYVQGGTRYTAPARTEGTKLIASGSSVWIVRISETQFYVTTI